MEDTYETQAKGLRILPGQWRPHYPFEQIAWVSPPWPSQDYVWLDFPEAIFTNQGLIYLSHINPQVTSCYHDLPRVPWTVESGRMTFQRLLPNGVRFGGRIALANHAAVALHLWIENGSSAPLRNIQLQTCVFLRACREFADFTMDNKYIHTPQQGWLSLPAAHAGAPEAGAYGLGWRGGPRIADRPIIVTLSNPPGRLLAITWYDSTLSLTGNAGHPCMHADPFFPDLDPGASASIDGSLAFFVGRIEDLTMDDLTHTTTHSPQA